MLAERGGNPHIAAMASGAVQERPRDAAAPARSAVARLMLTDFRGYASLRLAVDVRPVVLTGAYGAGKTNLLEAISFLAPGRGLRRAPLADIARRVPPAPPNRAPPGALAVPSIDPPPLGA